MDLTTDSRVIYSHFKSLSGSDCIATEFAVEGLIYWLKRVKPRVVLELGTGIGTLTFAAISTLENQLDRFISLDLKPEFTEIAKENLKPHSSNIEFVQSISNIDDPPSSYDFVIVDGGINSFELLEHTCNISNRGCIYVEHNRKSQREIISNRLQGKRKFAIINYRSFSRLHTGYYVYQFEPTLKDRMWFDCHNFFNRVNGSIRRQVAPPK